MSAKIYLYEAGSKGKTPRFKHLMGDGEITLYDLSRMQLADRIFVGNNVRSTRKLSSITDKPSDVVKESIEILTKHAMFKASGFQIDRYDNGSGEWARDVDYNESTINCPLTIMQGNKLTDKFDEGRMKGIELSAKITNTYRDNDTLRIDLESSTLQMLEKYWDLDSDLEGIEAFLNRSLRALNTTRYDQKENYLHVYHKSASPPRTLWEFQHSW